MSLFIKKKKGNLEEQGFPTKPVNRFSEAIEKNKVTLSKWLERKTERFSMAEKRAGLIVFCSVFAFLFIVLLGSSINSHRFNYRTIILSHPKSGVHDTLTSPVTDSVWKKVEETKAWMDSLKKTDMPRFKAFLLTKPYLLENLQLLEQLYQIQSK